MEAVSAKCFERSHRYLHRALQKLGRSGKLRQKEEAGLLPKQTQELLQQTNRLR